MSNHVTFGIGGPAKYFFEAKTVEDLIKALEVAAKNKLRFFVLGGGSNVLFLAKGFDGLVVKNSTGGLKREGNKITVDSGYDLHGLVRYTCKEELQGLEKLSWIPGTVGGAVYGNAGAHGRSMSDVVKSVIAYDIGQAKQQEVEATDCGFEYRHSIFKHDRNLVILRVVLQLQSSDRQSLETECESVKRQRQEKFPKLPSAGCFFQNVPKKEITRPNAVLAEVLNSIETDKIPSGLLIDRVGLKGKQIGGAKIAEKHANFIIDAGGATVDDILKLASLVKTRVRDKFGIELKPEVQIVG